MNDGDLTALNPGWQYEWKLDTGERAYPYSSAPTIGSDGTVYFGTNDAKLFTASAAGGLGWSYTVPTHQWWVDWLTGIGVQHLEPEVNSPAIGHAGNIYVSAEDGAVYSFEPDGTLRWTFETGERMRESTVSIAGERMAPSTLRRETTIYTPSILTGPPKWTYAAESTCFLAPVIGSEGTSLLWLSG